MENIEFEVEYTTKAEPAKESEGLLLFSFLQMCKIQHA